MIRCDVPGVAEMRAQGNIVDHEFDIEADGYEGRRGSKKWFGSGRLRRRGGTGQDDASFLALHRQDGLG